MRTNDSSITILPPDDGEQLDVQGARITVKSDHADGRIFFADHPMPAGFTTPLHSHEAEDEILYILSGEIVVFDGTAETTAGPGTFVYVPRGAQHRLSNPFKAEARMLTVSSQGGKLGSAFRAFDKASAEAGGPLPPAALGAICAANGMQVLAP